MCWTCCNMPHIRKCNFEKLELMISWFVRHAFIHCSFLLLKDGFSVEFFIDDVTLIGGGGMMKNAACSRPRKLQWSTIEHTALTKLPLFFKIWPYCATFGIKPVNFFSAHFKLFSTEMAFRIVFDKKKLSFFMLLPHPNMLGSYTPISSVDSNPGLLGGKIQPYCLCNLALVLSNKNTGGIQS